MFYNGAHVPPLSRVRPGDSLTVTLHNRLSEPTNLHFPRPERFAAWRRDNVFLHIQPRSDFTYHITIPEKHIDLLVPSALSGPSARFSFRPPPVIDQFVLRSVSSASFAANVAAESQGRESRSEVLNGQKAITLRKGTPA
jgi:hypothetical protein